MNNENDNSVEKVAFEEMPLDAGDLSYLVQLVAYDIYEWERAGHATDELAEILYDHQLVLNKLEYLYNEATTDSVNHPTFDELVTQQKENVDREIAR